MLPPNQLTFVNSIPSITHKLTFVNYVRKKIYSTIILYFFIQEWYNKTTSKYFKN